MNDSGSPSDPAPDHSPVYLLLRTNAVSNWADEDGRSYHYGSSVPNYTRIVPGARFLLERRFDDGKKLIGRGTIGNIEADANANPKQYRATYSEYTPFQTPIPVDAANEMLIRSLPGFNTQHAIHIINEDVFRSLEAGSGAEESDSPLVELADITGLPVDALQEIDGLIREKQQVILEGPPGSGKTFLANLFARYLTGNPLTGNTNSRYAMVQFHQSYGYEDFVQGIRPFTSGSGSLSYALKPGIFMRFCEAAAKDPQPHVMVIDEINRGNISRIFGELLLLLEYRAHDIELTYSDHNDGESVSKFAIPKNIFVIGTMNTADRSLSQIDYALRRRFYFYRLASVANGRAEVLDHWLRKAGVDESGRQRVVRAFVALNNRIGELLGDDFQVGHSYFMVPDIGTPGKLEQIWRRAIIPLLNEYFYGRRDWTKTRDEFAIDSLLRASNDGSG